VSPDSPIKDLEGCFFLFGGQHAERQELVGIDKSFFSR
jgi:hypothetical protein